MPEDISQYLKDRTFDTEARRTIEEAYKKARRMLGNRLQPAVFREVLAKRITYWTTTGEKSIRIKSRVVRC